MRRWLGALGLVLVGLGTCGCAMTFSASAFGFLNRAQKPESLDASLALARQLLEAGDTRESVVAFLVKRGTPQEQAEAVVTLAAAQCKCGGEK